MVRDLSASRFLRSSNWVRRWIVLQRPLVHIYKSFANNREVNVIDISRCALTVEPSDAAHGIPFSFRLSSSSYQWHLQGSTAAELRAWLVAIDPLKVDARLAITHQNVETTARTA